MDHRPVWLSLGLSIVVATMVFLIFHNAQNVKTSSATVNEFQEEDSLATMPGQSDTDSDVKSDRPSDFQDRTQVGESTESKNTTGDLEQAQPVGFHEIALSEVEKANLLQAPSVFLNRSPSDLLAKAIELGRVEYVRADRDFDQNEYVTQGWIYYEPIDEDVPVVLCLSQSKTIIDWMYCQEETRPLSR